jgi:S-formylglutathione hydrolase FrmB
MLLEGRRFTVTRVVCRLAAVLVLAALVRPGFAQQVVKTDEYDSPSVGRKLRCRVILPAGYESSRQRYPVLYLLHGFSGDYTKWSNHGVEKAAEPFALIVVLADGANSWYVNWAVSERGWKNRWEDAIVKDLIAHVDGSYRTIAARPGRAINGLSMGGYGAITLGLRHPDLFCSIASTSGALEMARGSIKTLAADPQAVIPTRNPQDKVNRAIGQPDFDSQEERTPYGRMFTTIAHCEAYDPFSLVVKVPRENLPHINIDCGTEDPFIGHNQEFLRLMMERKIPFTYAQSSGEHRSAYWSRAIGPAMAIQFQIMRRAIAESEKEASAAGGQAR